VSGIEVLPLTKERWPDLVTAFGPDRGAWGGCWCMWWRLSSKEFDAGSRDHGKANRRALRGLVDREHPPGLLAYVEGEVAGWVSVAPREEFGRLNRSPTLKPVDETPVWSVVCFYMVRRHRGRGVGTALLAGAVDHARANGARWIEAYPVDPEVKAASNADAYTGVVSMFERAGFREVARRKDNRPIMRRRLNPSRARRGRSA
jgi:GNAT superfamily N-acetyltransferase